MNCPKCGASMAEGFQLDKGHYNVGAASTWVSGKPRKSFWGGLSFKGTAAYTVQAYRCTACGYLESYARTPAG